MFFLILVFNKKGYLMRKQMTKKKKAGQKQLNMHFKFN